MEQFFTWDLLATYTGATTATVVIVECVKPQLKTLFPRFPTRTLVYLTAFGVMVLADYYTPPLFTLSTFLLDFINSFGVGLTAMGLYHQVLEKTEKRAKERERRREDEKIEERALEIVAQKDVLL